MKNKESQVGFGFVAFILTVVAAGLITGAGCWVYQQNRLKANNKVSVANRQPNAVQQTAANSDEYLIIKELGIRIKLAASTKDAYYTMDTPSITDKPYVRLSTHSLDAYPRCTAPEGGVAGIATFTEGYTDEVVGDFAKVYPAAPKIDGLYYFVAVDQYDCTLDEDSELHSSVRHAFADSYSTIEKIKK